MALAPDRRLQLWRYFAAVVNVMISAAGVYGFARATSAAQVTSLRRSPPSRPDPTRPH